MSTRPKTDHRLGTPLAGVLLALALLAVLELLARLAAFGPLGLALPFSPTLGVGNPQLDVKWVRLQAMQRQEPVNCLVIGSSMVDQGVDPDLLSQLLSEQTGETWRCFNLGVATLTGEMAGTVGQLAVQEAQPALLVWGLSARDFSAQFGELSRPLKNQPWIRYRSGEDLWNGWLYDHSFLYRYNMAFKSWLSLDNRSAMQKYQTSVTPSGFSPTDSVNADENPSGPLISGYAINQPDWEGLETVALLKGPLTRVVVIEMPVKQAFMPNYLEGGEAAYEALFIQPLTNYLASQDIPFLRFQALAGQIPEEGWSDRRHFNAAGGRQFTGLLAAELARLEAD